MSQAPRQWNGLVEEKGACGSRGEVGATVILPSLLVFAKGLLLHNGTTCVYAVPWNKFTTLYPISCGEGLSMEKRNRGSASKAFILQLPRPSGHYNHVPILT
jgi:hypothetical protein